MHTPLPTAARIEGVLYSGLPRTATWPPLLTKVTLPVASSPAAAFAPFFLSLAVEEGLAARSSPSRVVDCTKPMRRSARAYSSDCLSSVLLRSS